MMPLLAALAAACASASPYGNFLEHPSAQSQSFFALDTATQLRRVYPPAALPLVVPEAHDPFGQALIRRLRRIGFAVAEDGSAPPPNAVTVRYVLDRLGGGLFLITLFIWRTRDGAVLGRMNRPYGERAGVVHPAGPWTRQTVAEEEPAWTTN